jgi:hypothetical protein
MSAFLLMKFIAFLAALVCSAPAFNYKQAMPEHDLDLLSPQSFFSNYVSEGTAVLLTSTVKLLPQVSS